MILTTCAACAAPLAHNAPRCVRCHVRYCDATCQHDHWRMSDDEASAPHDVIATDTNASKACRSRNFGRSMGRGDVTFSLHLFTASDARTNSEDAQRDRSNKSRVDDEAKLRATRSTRLGVTRAGSGAAMTDTACNSRARTWRRVGRPARPLRQISPMAPSRKSEAALASAAATSRSRLRRQLRPYSPNKPSRSRLI